MSCYIFSMLHIEFNQLFFLFMLVPCSLCIHSLSLFLSPSISLSLSHTHIFAPTISTHFTSVLVFVGKVKYRNRERERERVSIRKYMYMSCIIFWAFNPLFTMFLISYFEPLIVTRKSAGIWGKSIRIFIARLQPVQDDDK